MKYNIISDASDLWIINIQRNYIKSLPSDLYYSNVGIRKPWIDFNVYLSRENVLDLRTDEKKKVILKWIKDNGIELNPTMRININAIYKVDFEAKQIFINDFDFGDKTILSKGFKTHKISKNNNKRKLENIANAFIKSDKK